MINQITKYFSNQNLQIFSGNYLSRNNHIKLQHQTINAVNKVLTTFFKKFYILISKPSYSIQANTIKITIFYYQPEKIVSVQGRKTDMRNKYWSKFLRNFKGLTSPDTNVNLSLNSKSRRVTFLALLLSKMLQSNVQLELVRLKYVYHDSNILAQFLGLNSHKSTYGQFKNILRRKVTIQDSDEASKNNTSIANTSIVMPITYLTGFKIKISGRLNRQRVVPKKTVKSTYKGAISANINNVVDQSTFTGKNKKGAYSIRVWISHGTKPITPPKA